MDDTRRIAACRGIVFDLDGTLYHMPWFTKPLLFASLVPHGFRLPAYMKVRERFAGRDMGGGAALMDAMAAQLGSGLGIGAEAARGWIDSAFYAKFVAMMKLLRGSRPGLPDTFRGLRARGVRLAVLSDFARVPERLVALGIDPALFDTLASSETDGALKPSPRPFQTIAGAWGLAGSDLLIVGDRDDTDGEAARAIGAAFVHLHPKRALNWPRVRELLATVGPSHS